MKDIKKINSFDTIIKLNYNEYSVKTEKHTFSVTGASNIAHGWKAENLTDGGTTGSAGWHTSENVTDAWVTFDLGETKNVTYLSAFSRMDDSGNGVSQYAARFIKDFDLYIGNTAPTYQDYTGNDGTYEVNGTEKEDFVKSKVGTFSFENPSEQQEQTIEFKKASGRYVTLHILNTYGGNCLNIMEMNVGSKTTVQDDLKISVEGTAYEDGYDTNAEIYVSADNRAECSYTVEGGEPTSLENGRIAISGKGNHTVEITSKVNYAEDKMEAVELFIYEALELKLETKENIVADGAEVEDGVDFTVISDSKGLRSYSFRLEGTVR